MSAATASASVASVVLSGKTAKELRELLASGATTTAAVIAHLSGKTTLRPQSQRLLEELNGSKPAKAAAKAKAEPAPAKPKAAAPALEPVKAEPAPAPAPAKAEKKAPRVSNEAILAAIEGLVARVEGIERKVDNFAALLAAVEAAPAPSPAVEAVTPTPAVEVPESDADLAGSEEQDDGAPVTWEAEKARLEAENVATLREMCKGLDLPSGGKKDALIERLLTCYVEVDLVLPRVVVNNASNSVSAEF